MLHSLVSTRMQCKLIAKWKVCRKRKTRQNFMRVVFQRTVRYAVHMNVCTYVMLINNSFCEPPIRLNSDVCVRCLNICICTYYWMLFVLVASISSSAGSCVTCLLSSECCWFLLKFRCSFFTPTKNELHISSLCE